MATPSEILKPVERFCVVCGAGSHRSDWINKLGDYVACDSHSKQELADAVASKTSSAAPPAKPLTPVATQAPAQAKK